MALVQHVREARVEVAGRSVGAIDRQEPAADLLEDLDEDATETEQDDRAKVGTGLHAAERLGVTGCQGLHGDRSGHAVLDGNLAQLCDCRRDIDLSDPHSDTVELGPVRHIGQLHDDALP